DEKVFALLIKAFDSLLQINSAPIYVVHSFWLAFTKILLQPSLLAIIRRHRGSRSGIDRF
ncbi:MAG: hypothetical protein ACLFQ6_03205, partial [Candidatus Sumerlaeia bacterium]